MGSQLFRPLTISTLQHAWLPTQTQDAILDTFSPSGLARKDHTSAESQSFSSTSNRRGCTLICHEVAGDHVGHP
jgi:hypothetical protein